jgi:hypothetical protein
MQLELEWVQDEGQCADGAAVSSSLLVYLGTLSRVVRADAVAMAATTPAWSHNTKVTSSARFIRSRNTRR